MGTIATVVLDDVDVTDLCMEGTFTRRLNAISTASVKIQMKELAGRYGTYPNPNVGSYLKIYFENDILGTSIPTLYFHGRVMLCETTADENSGYVVFNASDPLELWQHRPVRGDDGDFSKPDELLTDYIYATEVTQAIFNNSEDTTAGGGGPPPTDAEGPLRMRLNSLSGGVTSIVGAPTDWPMTMAEFAQLLISTGTLDMVVTPIEFDVDDNYGQLDLYNGDYGNDLTGSVSLSYGMGDFNVRALRYNTDLTDVCNKLWYYLGPRVETSDDPAGDQHWRANIQGDDPGLDYPPGGESWPPCDNGPLLGNEIGYWTCHSRTLYDVRMEIKIYDARGDEAPVAHNLYRRLWQLESYLRAQPRNIVHVTPVRDYGIGLFDIGDLITVEAVADVNGGFSGGQRVYAYTISWTADESVCEMGEIQVSGDQQGFTN
jgi:hypothetical protein